MKASDVIKIGRKRSFAPARRGHQSAALFSFRFGKFYDQDRIFRDQTNYHHEPDLG